MLFLSQGTVCTNPQFLKGHSTDWQGVDLEAETAKGCPKRQELKQEQKFFEFCLGRLETIFYAIFALCSAGVSSRPWHLLQCKLLDDRDVLVAGSVLNSVWEGIKYLKAIRRKGYRL